MKITNKIKIMEQVNTEKIICFKMGEFYYEYGKDSYIMAYLFGYKIRKTDEDIAFSGFSTSAINKVITKLEEKNISYIIVDKSLNYEVIEEENFKKNNYIDTFESAKIYVQERNRVDNIYNYLMKNIDDEKVKEKIGRIEEIINEGRKI